MHINLGYVCCAKKQLIYSARRSFSIFKTVFQSEQVIQRSRGKRTQAYQDDQSGNFKNCIAYCHGESYKWDEVTDYFSKSNQRYSLGILPKDAPDVLHVSCISNEIIGDLFLFRRLGAFVCWNIANDEISLLKQVLIEYVVGSVEAECETLNYLPIHQDTCFLDGNIHLNTTVSKSKQILDKLAFSNAMALSVKLGMWELSLETFSGSLRHLPELFKSGHSKIMSRKEVMQKIGELLTIRHEINLYSDLLLTPDFYWDREDLELHYTKTCKYLEIPKRTMVMNEKLDLCSEVVEMLRSHLSDQYSHRLEWMIIILISVEVLFEIIHYLS